MSRRFHNAIRTRLLPPRCQDMKAPRPVLLNSWEACYFDFDEAKLLALAGAARQADIDLFVLDDGWFKGRNGTASSLGDWTADRTKLPDGLPGLCAKLNAMDLGLGLWVEPEAVSPDSDLYRAHPDWAFAVPGRQPCQIRYQYNLDLSRPEVVDGVWQQLEQVLRSCPIQYLKWDMNRALADVYSPALPAARQGEVYHRYVLGLYELQRRVTETFPDLLLENCAGGRRPLRLRHALLQPPDLVQRQHRRPGPADHPVRHQPVLPRLRRGGPLLGGAQPLQRPPLHHRGADGGGPLGHLRL